MSDKWKFALAYGAVLVGSVLAVAGASMARADKADPCVALRAEMSKADVAFLEGMALRMRASALAPAEPHPGESPRIWLDKDKALARLEAIRVVSAAFCK